MKERLNKLLAVKSLVTLPLTLVFAYLAIVGSISGEQFMAVYTMIIGFYFGTQHEKKADKEVTENV